MKGNSKMKADTPTILMTGGTGYIGSELTRQLSKSSSSDLNHKSAVSSGDAITIVCRQDAMRESLVACSRHIRIGAQQDASETVNR